jgi:hypothetical protein
MATNKEGEKKLRYRISYGMVTSFVPLGGSEHILTFTQFSRCKPVLTVDTDWE